MAFLSRYITGTCFLNFSSKFVGIMSHLRPSRLRILSTLDHLNLFFVSVGAFNSTAEICRRCHVLFHQCCFVGCLSLQRHCLPKNHAMPADDSRATCRYGTGGQGWKPWITLPHDFPSTIWIWHWHMALYILYHIVLDSTIQKIYRATFMPASKGIDDGLGLPDDLQSHLAWDNFWPMYFDERQTKAPAFALGQFAQMRLRSDGSLCNIELPSVDWVAQSELSVAKHWTAPRAVLFCAVRIRRADSNGFQWLLAM